MTYDYLYEKIYAAINCFLSSSSVTVQTRNPYCPVSCILAGGRTNTLLTKQMRQFLEANFLEKLNQGNKILSENGDCVSARKISKIMT